MILFRRNSFCQTEGASPEATGGAADPSTRAGGSDRAWIV